MPRVKWSPTEPFMLVKWIASVRSLNGNCTDYYGPFNHSRDVDDFMEKHWPLCEWSVEPIFVPPSAETE